MLSVLWSKKSRAILEFRKCLPTELTAEYNDLKRYSKEQVAFIVATKHAKYIDYIEYALAMFLWEEDFIKYNKSIGELYSPDEIEKDIKFNLREESDKSSFRKSNGASDGASMGH